MSEPKTDSGDADSRKLVVYYDASCALCSAEMCELDELRPDTMELRDCSAPGFETDPVGTDAVRAGFSTEDMMAAMHVRDEAGRWHIGVDAFEVIYRRAGFPRIAALWGSRRLRPLLLRVYPWIARHRQTLSRFGVPRLQRWALRAAAWFGGHGGAPDKPRD